MPASGTLESQQEPHDCRLPRSGGADDGDELAGADLQAHVAEHLRSLVLTGIAERDRAQGQGSAQTHRLEHGGGKLGLRLQDRPHPVVERRQIEQIKQSVADGKNRGDHVGECNGKGKEIAGAQAIGAQVNRAEVDDYCDQHRENGKEQV